MSTTGKFIFTIDRKTILPSSANQKNIRNNVESSNSLWIKLQFNEWTFTFLLFLLSSSIFFGKLFLNYDVIVFLDVNIVNSTMKESRYYYKEITDIAIIEPLKEYSWFIKAIFSGLAVTGLSWFIIYEDSNIPGINPPSPFSPLKQRIVQSSTLQINYIVGSLIGLVMFFYMCL